jgi:hypothetical protein
MGIGKQPDRNNNYLTTNIQNNYENYHRLAKRYTKIGKRI